jgi:hypothetical protein
MADERDPKVSQRYRELGTEEPPRHLDEAILAASRRAGRRRWYFPVAAAAVVMLAAGVALHVERDQPGPEVAVLMKRQAEEAPKEKKLAEAPAAARAPAPAPAREPEAAAKAFAYSRESRPEVRQEQQAQDRVVVEALRKDKAARDRRASAAEARPAPELGAVAGAVGLRGLQDQPPEKWLETITELRKAGQHEEADKLLEEFRKRYPDHKIPEPALKK